MLLDQSLAGEGTGKKPVELVGQGWGGDGGRLGCVWGDGGNVGQPWALAQQFFSCYRLVSGSVLNLTVKLNWRSLLPSREVFPFFFFFFLSFLGPHLQYMDVPRLGILISAVAADLHQSHSNARSEPCL